MTLNRIINTAAILIIISTFPKAFASEKLIESNTTFISQGRAWYYAINASSEKLAVAHTSGVFLYDLAKLLPLTTNPIVSGFVNAMSWSPDSKYLAIYQNGLKTIDASTGELAHAFTDKGIVYDERNPARLIEWSPDGKYLAVLYQDQIHIWDVSQKQLILNEDGETNSTFASEGRGMDSFKWSLDSQQLALAEGTTIRVWNIKDWLHPVSMPAKRAVALAWTSNNKLNSLQVNRGATEVHSWNLVSNIDSIDYSLNFAITNVFALEAGESYFAVDNGNQVMITQTANGQEIHRFSDFEARVEQATWLKNGQELLIRTAQGSLFRNRLEGNEPEAQRVNYFNPVDAAWSNDSNSL